ncbi:MULTISPECIES: carboxypeptidase M32 [unclassified Anaeromyxobacter]|uniref:carboxypeptidase M32 n=1 Tax=unclassified Anaeromyxobacter TaxID=2620896 RepID=UPI001F56416D|nr:MULTISPECIES: carboxypeptidase M32 [unclassified Anaeromyxobacter]
MPETAPAPRSAAWETLAAVMCDVRALGGAVSLLQWDQETFMPAKGAVARGDQLAAVQAALHERLTQPRVAEALDLAEREASGDPDRAAALRALRFDHERAARVPQDLVRALAQAQAEGVDAWKAARNARAFALFAPKLARLVELRREQADALMPMLARRPEAQPDPGASEPYDALLEGYEPGMRVARLEPILRRLVGWLSPLVAAIDAAPAPEDGFLSGRFDGEAQWGFTLELLAALGFDPAAGRQDRSLHPFTLGLDPGDVRVTTRVYEAQPLSAIFSTLHEAGHGLYEQHLPGEHRRSLLCAAPSMGIHESQSRLWENLVGRSLPFWRAFLPRLAARFPQLAGVAPADFHRAVNRVERSLVRVEADEVTYNLHVALRFELELGMMRGTLAVSDLPEAWAARSEALLGVRPRDDAEGVLQDIHWAWGDLGYFPTYTLGNLYAATLFAAAGRALPGLDDAIAAGDLAPLRRWLAEKVYRVGRRKDAEDIVRDAAGVGLTDADFERYVKTKYGALYGLTL